MAATPFPPADGRQIMRLNKTLVLHGFSTLQSHCVIIYMRQLLHFLCPSSGKQDPRTRQGPSQTLQSHNENPKIWACNSDEIPNYFKKCRTTEQLAIIST